MSLNIGNIKIDPPLILAPMAGITDLAFRLTVKSKGGCGLVYSEMVSANALVRNHKRTRHLLDSHPDERPLAVQIFGSDPQVMAEAGRIVEDMGADILDINMGCPVKKVVKTGAGSALMRSPSEVGKLVKAVRAGVGIPLTVKIRAGWDSTSINAAGIARILEDNGADAVTVHPRTRSQGFSAHADWDLIGQVKQILSIPVIGNGDISSGADARKLLDQSGCDAVMIGRATRGDPWIFKRVQHFLENGYDTAGTGKTNHEELHKTVLTHLRLVADNIGEDRATHLFKKHAAWYIKGYPGCHHFRGEFFSHNRYEALLESIENFFASIPTSEF